MQLDIAHPVSGYQVVKKDLPSAREVEYRAFAKCTADLTSAMQENATFPELAAAIGKNRDLWRIIAADVLASENGLPSELRANLIYLQEFTHQHSSKVLRGDASVEALVEVNKSVMRGLRGDSGESK